MLLNTSLRAAATTTLCQKECKTPGSYSFVYFYTVNELIMQRRQGTVRFKTKAGGEQAREALLETKTHRRVNRRQVKHQDW